MTGRLYVETSAALRLLLEGDDGLREVFSSVPLVSSALTFVEAYRAIARARREGRIDARAKREAERWLKAFERSCEVIRLEDEVLSRSRGEFPEEPVRTLDAIHLASMLVLDAELGGIEVASCDERVRRNAQALGLPVRP